MLSDADAAALLAARGGARAPRSSRSAWSIVRANVFTLFNAILMFGGAVTLIFGDPRDALFLGILVANTVIGVGQELRAKRELDRLAALVAPDARVVRDGRERIVPLEEVVPGDLVRAGAGDQIVADGLLAGDGRVLVDESILTGESRAVIRVGGDEVRSGSFVVEGVAEYEARDVGPDSYAERIAGVARTFRHPRSPLERGLNRLLMVTVAAVAPLAVVLGVGLVLHTSNDRTAAVQTGVAGLVSLVPEGLILLASMTAAVAALRMTRRGALVQQLNGVESLASVDLLCLDKTGTLTRPDLRVETLIPAVGVSAEDLRGAVSRLAAATPDRNRTMEALALAHPATAEPTRAIAAFSSQRRWSAVELADGVLVLAAPEALELGGLASEAQRLAAEGRRVVAIGRCPGPLAEPDGADPPPSGITALGLVVLAEALRADARETVAFLREEGVELRILSGDAPATVAAIARDAGISGHLDAADGTQLPQDDEELAALLEGVAVVGRVSPDDKRRIIEALGARGHYVAMIGDGVNDVPALKASRLAIAQGNGTQMARGVADVVLVDGDFASIPPMVHEGRQILRNIQRVARLFVSKSVFAAILIVVFAVSGLAYPFIPRQISLAATLNLGFPAFILALASSAGPWRPEAFVRDIVRFAIPGGIALAVGVLSAELASVHLLGQPTAEARTVATCVLVLVGLAYVVALEGRERRRIAAAVTLPMVLVLAVMLSVPWLRRFFELTTPQWDMLACVACGTLLALAVFTPLWRLTRGGA